METYIVVILVILFLVLRILPMFISFQKEPRAPEINKKILNQIAENFELHPGEPPVLLRGFFQGFAITYSTRSEIIESRTRRGGHKKRQVRIFSQIEVQLNDPSWFGGLCLQKAKRDPFAAYDPPPEIPDDFADRFRFFGISTPETLAVLSDFETRDHFFAIHDLAPTLSFINGRLFLEKRGHYRSLKEFQKDLTGLLEAAEYLDNAIASYTKQEEEVFKEEHEEFLQETADNW